MNEPVLGYREGSPERAEIQRRIKEMRAEVVDIPVIIDGKEIRTGNTCTLLSPPPALSSDPLLPLSVLRIRIIVALGQVHGINTI